MKNLATTIDTLNTLAKQLDSEGRADDVTVLLRAAGLVAEHALADRKPRVSNLTTEARAKGNKSQADKAVKDNWDLVIDLCKLRGLNKTLREIADNFNERGVKTRQGAEWNPVQIKRLLDRVENLNLDWGFQVWSNGGGWIDVKSGYRDYWSAYRAMQELAAKDGRKYQVEVWEIPTD